MENIKRTRARVVITSNAGCALQIAREARAQGEQLAVVHPMEILDWSYRRIKPNWRQRQ
jgi:glycolate oxidase iron-sulfur subunit